MSEEQAGRPHLAITDASENSAVPASVARGTRSSGAVRARSVMRRVLVVVAEAEGGLITAGALPGDDQVMKVVGGPAALAAMVATPPTVVIAEAGIPVPGTGDLLDAVRQRSELRQLPFILICASADELADGFERGADDCVVAPVTPVELEARICATERLVALRADLLETRRLADLGSVIAQFSHEINNPANVVSNNLPPMREYLGEISALLAAYQEAEAYMGDAAEPLRGRREHMDLRFVLEDFGDAIEAVDSSIDRILGIQRNLRSYLRGEAPALRAGDVNLVVRSAVEAVRAASMRGTAIDVRMGEISPCLIESLQLEQVIINLLRNALDAIGEIGEVIIETRCTGTHILVEVRDTGSGVPEALRSEIFEPFFTTKPVGLGTGLGLSVCRQIIEQHGGRLTLDPDYVDGACFTIELPMLSTAHDPRAAAVSADDEE
ncbi:sensor histidine kinase [Haliangium sp.]|uniref:sensor histidine kinase n=1 Tax=Haliangium sp. TaxID=2663208 RepID=UPI003D0D4B1D